MLEHRPLLRRLAGSAPGWLLVLIPLLICYAPVLLGRVVVHRDMARWIYPARWFVRDAWTRGEAATWNPLVGLGFSTLADPLYGPYYPPNWLTLVGPLALMCTLLWLLHLLAGGVGVALLARRFDVPQRPAAVGGVAWALSGFIGSTWTTGVLLPAAALLPWAGLGFVEIACAGRDRRRWLRAVALLALVIGAQLLLGEVFVCAMGVGLGIGLASTWSCSHGDEAAPRWLAAGAVAGVSGGALTGGVSLIPAVMAASSTSRAAPLPLELAEGWSVHPMRWLEFVASGALGRAWEQHGDSPAWAQQWLDGSPLSLDLYLGGSVVALVGLALTHRTAPPRRRRMVWGVLAVALIALAVAMGSHLPVHRLVRWLVPPMAHMRSPEKYLAVVIPCVAILSALGAARLTKAAEEPAASRLWLPPVVVAAGIGLIAVGAGALLPAQVVPFARAGAVQGLLGATAVALVAWQARRRPGAVGLVLILIVAMDLGATTVRIVRLGPAEILEQTPSLATAIRPDAAAPAGDRPPPRLYRSKKVSAATARHAGQTEARTQATLRENVSVSRGIAIVPGYEAAAPPTVGAMIDLRRTAVLRMMAIGHVLLPERDPEQLKARPGFEPVMAPLPGAGLHRVVGALPRAYVAAPRRLEGSQIAPEQLLREDVVDGRAVWIEATAPGAFDAAADVDAVAGRCTITAFHNTELIARCESSAPAVAVFVEQQNPGWTATVDGRPAPVAVANGFARAVPIAAGRSEIHLSFEPAGLATGRVATAAGLALALLGLGLSRRRRSATPGSHDH